ncbi:MAG: hypothetical protein ACLGHN_05425 [Bacteriovoracia bacterium]
MKWRNSYLIILSPLLLVALIFMNSGDKAETMEKQTREVASKPVITKKRSKRIILTEKKARFFRDKSKGHLILRNRIPQSVEASFLKDKSVKLTRGYEFLQDVAAIQKDKFEPLMGEVLQKSDHFIFFRTRPGHPFIPVAISRSTNILYPLSSILHIKKATPEIRTKLLSEGHIQYYYYPPLKLLSLESKSGELLKLYSLLRDQGYQVELEVLKPPHQKI